MYLARKVTRAKWAAKQGLATGEIPADAVTIDLRTQGNSLSFWQCPTGTASDVEEAALAIAAAREHIDRLDLVLLDAEELQADGQSLVNTEGRTPVTDLAALHVDVSRLDYARLGRIADHVVVAIEKKRHRRITKARVRKLIAAAVEKGRIDLDHLECDVREEVASRS